MVHYTIERGLEGRFRDATILKMIVGWIAIIILLLSATGMARAAIPADFGSNFTETQRLKLDALNRGLPSITLVSPSPIDFKAKMSGIETVKFAYDYPVDANKAFFLIDGQRVRGLAQKKNNLYQLNIDTTAYRDGAHKLKIIANIPNENFLYLNFTRWVAEYDVIIDNTNTNQTPPVGPVNTEYYRASSDALLHSRRANKNYANGKHLVVGGKYLHESILKFDVKSVKPIISATLRMYVEKGNSRDSQVFALERNIATLWSEQGVNWYSSRSFNQYLASSYVDMPATSGGHWVNVDVTPLITSSGVNYLMLKSNSTRFAKFASSETTILNHRPELIINAGV